MLKIIKYVKYIAYGSSDSKIFKTVCCKGASLDLKKKTKPVLSLSPRWNTEKRFTGITENITQELNAKLKDSTCRNWDVARPNKQ